MTDPAQTPDVSLVPVQLLPVQLLPVVDQPLGAPPLAPATVVSEVLTIAVPDLVVDVECPTCGTPARIDANRRDAEDFCVTCDFPLFWAVERSVVLAAPDTGDTGLRRLPGTAGRTTLSFVSCPGCTEPNVPSAVQCTRCAANLHPIAGPLPVPVVVADAPVELVEEPTSRNWWWLALAIATALALLVLLLVLLLN